MENFVLFAAASAESGNVVQEIAKQFGFKTEHFIAQVISFAIVAFLLHRFAYKPILQILEERRHTIAEALANADRIKAELAKTEAARLEVLGQANLQANKLIEEARAAAARVQEQETQKAIAGAELIITKAREAAAMEHARMLSELRREVGQLVVQTASRVTGKILTPEDQKRLTEETTKQLAA
ncbi:MAG: ATP synthase F0 subunit B [Pedosphaera sp.]|nr:ATP synthase F0 subunit B [Pedosphaera sp.]